MKIEGEVSVWSDQGASEVEIWWHVSDPRAAVSAYLDEWRDPVNLKVEVADIDERGRTLIGAKNTGDVDVVWT